MKRIVLLLLTALLLISPVAAAEIPSLFHNDDAWYKDGISPMIEREGKRYIPADIFTMFDYMNVSTPTSDNLLLHNTESGRYVSLLFSQQRALINGEVHEGIGMFRDGGVYYVDADAVCEGLGFTTRLYICEDGSLSMQICDGNVISKTFAELVKSYLPDEEEEEYPEEDYEADVEEDREDNSASLICLLCAEPNPAAEFTALESLTDERLRYTMFLDGVNDERNLIRYGVSGLFGLTVPETENAVLHLDAVSEQSRKITRQYVRLIRSTDDDDTDEELRRAGYYPVKPDFKVNGASHPESLLQEILDLADERGYCTVWLEDCWNTELITGMIAELDETRYRTANLVEPAPVRAGQ